MPSGVKDWLAGKNPALAQRQRSRERKANNQENRRKKEGVTNNRANHRPVSKPRGDNSRNNRPSQASAQEIDNDPRAQKRLDQQRALDRRFGATSAQGTPPAGAAWLDVADAHSNGGEGGNTPGSTLAPDLRLSDGIPEPKEKGRGGGSTSGQTWSLANSGKAAMADGEDWDLNVDELADGAQEKVEAVARDDGEAFNFRSACYWNSFVTVRSDFSRRVRSIMPESASNSPFSYHKECDAVQANLEADARPNSRFIPPR